MGAFESGRSLADLVLAKLPESLRAELSKALAAPEAKDAITLLGESALARSDYSKSMDDISKQTADLKAKEAQIVEDYENLNKWYADNKATVEKAGTLEAEIAKLKGEKPPVGDSAKPVAGMTKDEMLAVLNERDKGYASVLAVATTLSTKHLRDFNEVLDTADLIQLATKNQSSLSDAYQTKYATQLAAKAKTEEDARIKKLVDEQLAEERKKQQDQPFPLRNQAPSVLDVLSQKDRDPNQFSADAAAAEYERLVSARST